MVDDILCRERMFEHLQTGTKRVRYNYAVATFTMEPRCTHCHCVGKC